MELLALPPLPPLQAIGGGLLIGTAAAAFALLLGRIAGISGLLATATRLSTDRSGPPWAIAIAFVLGLPVGALLTALLAGPPQVTVTNSLPLLVLGGLLTGYGTRLGGGCTSGHGVCGIARLSSRSLAATAIFMTAGALTVFVVRHLAGA